MWNPIAVRLGEVAADLPFGDDAVDVTHGDDAHPPV